MATRKGIKINHFIVVFVMSNLHESVKVDDLR